MPTYGRTSLYEQWAQANPLGAKPVYEDKYSDQMQDLYKQISGRGPFQYDATKDAMFQSYKDNYVRQGKLAMKDTMGQAAALTGGYGNTYGQQVGQQAYDAYLQNLGDVIPQLYSMAYQQYQDQGDALMKQYGMLGDMRDRDYGLYRDAVGDWQNNAEFLRALEADEYNRDYNERQFAYQQQRDAWDQAMQQQKFAYQQQQDALTRQWNEENRDYERQWNTENRDYERQWNEENRAYDRAWNESGRAYERQQDAYNNLYTMIKSSGYTPSDAELAAAGMSRDAARAMRDEYNRGLDLDERSMSLQEMKALGYGGGGGTVSSPSEWWDYDPDRGWYQLGSSGGSNPYADYGGDIWDESQAQYRSYGYQATSNDLKDLYDSGAISQKQYTRGQLAADMLWTQDHATNVAKAAVANTKTKTAGEDWNEIRKRMGI